MQVSAIQIGAVSVAVIVAAAAGYHLNFAHHGNRKLLLICLLCFVIAALLMHGYSGIAGPPAFSAVERLTLSRGERRIRRLQDPRFLIVCGSMLAGYALAAAKRYPNTF
jgi:hypothetical protein